MDRVHAQQQQVVVAVQLRGSAVFSAPGGRTEAVRVCSALDIVGKNWLGGALVDHYWTESWMLYLLVLIRRVIQRREDYCVIFSILSAS